MWVCVVCLSGVYGWGLGFRLYVHERESFACVCSFAMKTVACSPGPPLWSIAPCNLFLSLFPSLSPPPPCLSLSQVLQESMHTHTLSLFLSHFLSLSLSLYTKTHTQRHTHMCRCRMHTEGPDALQESMHRTVISLESSILLVHNTAMQVV
jgi:hypothetical protein